MNNEQAGQSLQRGGQSPQRGSESPQRGSESSQRGSESPQRGSQSSKNSPSPQPDEGGECPLATQPALCLVVAVARNGVIGRDNDLPWRLPKDLAYFKRVTMGHPIIMGRKTFDSIGRPLPGRCNIVVTQQAQWHAEGVEVVHSLTEALDLARAKAREQGVDQIMLIGGAQLFVPALPMAQRLYLTQVHADVVGDTYFPEFELDDWHEVERENCFADDSNPFDYSFVVYNRRS